MKKNLILLFILCCFCLRVSAQEFDFFDKSAMDAFNNPRKTKPVDEKQYQQVMQKLQEEKDKKKLPKRHFWEKKPKKMEGTPLQNSLTGGLLPQPYLLIQISQNLSNEESIIPLGFYTVAFDNKNNTLLLKQGYTVISSVKMIRTPIEPTTDDLYYVRANPEKEGIKFLYGEIDKHYEAFCRFAK